MLTNRLGLPAALVRAVENDPYTRGDSDISATGLIAPPYQRALRERVEPQEDASDRIWSLLGQSTHAILERAYPIAQVDDDVIAMREFYQQHGYLRENRLYGTVDGWRLSGQFDVLEAGILKDYKVTSAWSVIGEHKREWEEQLNVLRLLAHWNGLPVEGLQIVAILRDWSRAKAKVTSEKDYPKLPVALVDIPLWPLEAAEEFVRARVALHADPNPEPCSDTERWKTEDVWALMKEGRKSAVKLFAVQSEATEALDKAGKGHSLVLRPGEYRRCAEYCNVSHACPAYQGEVLF
jgi:hypothetical protein